MVATLVSCTSADESVVRVVRRVTCLVVVDARDLAGARLGARELTVEVDFVVTVVTTLESLSSSSEFSGGGDGIVFRRRFGED